MSKSIDWDYWQKLPEIKAFEAIALLHGAEPESEPPDDASPEYRKALRLLLACLSDRSIFTPGTLNLGDPALHGVKLIEVGTWARANGYSLPDKFPRPTADLTAIDWAFWRNMRTVKLWQACALVVGFDPDKLRHHPQGWMAGPGAGPMFVDKSFPSLDARERFGKALRLAESAVSYMNGPIFPQGTPAPDHKQEKDVFLSQVVAHFVACEWANIPEPLHAIAQAAAPVATLAPTETKEQRQDRRLKACIDAGLKMDKAALSRLPDGVGEVADKEGVTRQAFSTDIKAALERKLDALKAGGNT